MITIAGAKGGCGKTTTTLGLAKALADEGSPTIAVDADRQLPDLHTTAEVDREPTVAALDGDRDVSEVAKQVPGAPGVGVVPAQLSSETVDLEATLERLDYDSLEVLVDSPSGAGPDVVEPISVADEVVVVTTGTERSVDAARTTIDIARRLDVPVAGVVFTRCETLPESLADDLDADVLGTIPEREQPLSDEDVRTAYEAVATALTDEAGRLKTESPVTRPDRMPTGVNGLDRVLGGGVTPGSVLALEADPASQSELLLHDLTATRGTLYVTTDRSEAVVRDAVDASPVEAGNPTIRHLDGDDPLAEATALVRELPQEANLVVDPIDTLETADRDAYVDFLNEVAERVRETESLAVLHALDGDDRPPLRNATEHVADAVVRFESVAGDGAVRNQVEVQKFLAEARPGRTEPVQFNESVPVERPSQ